MEEEYVLYGIIYRSSNGRYIDFIKHILATFPSREKAINYVSKSINRDSKGYIKIDNNKFIEKSLLANYQDYSIVCQSKIAINPTL